jgi:hypothetical protein
MDSLPIVAAVLSVLAVQLARRHRLAAKWSVFRRRLSKVSDGRTGLVRLEGRATAADQPLVHAPISGTKCLFYDCVVQQKSGDSFRQVRREYRGVCFHIDDGTGIALVRFQDAGQSPAVSLEVDGPPAVSCAIPLDRKATSEAELRAALERTAVIRAGDDLPRRLSAREGCIAPGDHVSVVGIAGVIVRGQLDLRATR